MTDDLSSLTQVLDVHRCWELLRSQEVGRLAVIIGDHPDIFPVNYVVDHGSVVFRTAAGTKLAGAVMDAAVAFEVDGQIDDDAWSVVLKGRAAEIEQMHELFDALDLPLYPWQLAPKHRFVRIVPDEVSGRRFQIADRAARHTGEIPVHRARVE